MKTLLISCSDIGINIRSNSGRYRHKLYKIFELDRIENFINLLFDNTYSENDTSISEISSFLCHESLLSLHIIFFFNDSIYQTTSRRQGPKIQRLLILFLWKLFSAYSVCAIVAQRTLGRLIKFVDMVGWAVLHRNLGSVIATFRVITKADLPINFTIFHSRMSTI